MIDLDLFAGAGGLAIGLKAAGFGPTQIYELDKHSCETLRQNADGNQPTIAGKVQEGDVQSVEWSTLGAPVRLLAAGAPCQPFSLGGKHRAQHDGRNLFPEVLRTMRSLAPQAVLLENVRGPARHRQAGVVIRSDCSGRGLLDRESGPQLPGVGNHPVP